MPRKKKTEVADVEVLGKDEIVSVVPRKPTDWMQLIKVVSAEHWRTLEVTIRIRDKLLAGKPVALDAAKAMIKARGLEDVIEAKLEQVTDPAERERMANEVKDEGLCEFHRRPDRPGCWFPTNHIKAGLKENWSVLGLRVEHRGSRGALAEGVFVFAPPTNPAIPNFLGPDGQPLPADPAERDWVYLADKPAGVHMAVAHTMGPSGPLSSIKRHEYIERPTIKFRVAIANAIAQKLPDNAFAATLVHFQEHGLGACRSQGFGRFDVVDMIELGSIEVKGDSKEDVEKAVRGIPATTVTGEAVAN